MMKSLAVVFVVTLWAMMGLSQAQIGYDEEDDLEYDLRFQDFHDMFAKEHAQTEKDRKPFTPEEIKAALKDSLPADPDQRELELAELFHYLEAQGHQKGKGHQDGQGQGRRLHPGPRSPFRGKAR